jgi:hypothetical protein
MPRIYRKAKSKRPEINPVVWKWLCDENPDERDENGKFSWEIFALEGEWLHYHGAAGDKLRELWEEVQDDILEDWVAERPGTRPRLWWRYSAPRISAGSWEPTNDSYLDGRLPEPRLQTSGAGAPVWEHFAYAPSFEYGLPASWVGFDPADAPRFESQASYLRRHDLLTAKEKHVLKASDFEPEAPAIPEDEVLTDLSRKELTCRT